MTSLGRREFIAAKVNKAQRRDQAPGVVTALTSGYQLLVLVQHEGASQPGVYLPEELQLNSDAYWRVTYRLRQHFFYRELPTFDTTRDFEAQLAAVDGKVLAVEGPFFGAKALVSGPLPPLSLYERLRR